MLGTGRPIQLDNCNGRLRGCKCVSSTLRPFAGPNKCADSALQGGMPGAERLRDDPTLQRLLQRQASGDRLVAAMCASD